MAIRQTIFAISLATIILLITANILDSNDSFRGSCKNFHSSPLNTGPYQAPMANSDMLRFEFQEVIPQSYIIGLREDYTIDQHKQIIANQVGFDSVTKSGSISSGLKGCCGPSYRAILDDDALAAVRGDSGVKFVEFNIRILDPWDVEWTKKYVEPLETAEDIEPLETEKDVGSLETEEDVDSLEIERYVDALEIKKDVDALETEENVDSLETEEDVERTWDDVVTALYE